MGNDVLSLAAGIPVDGGGLLGDSGGSFLRDFGGPATLGLSMLAANQPSPVRMPFGAILGKSALGARDFALSNAYRQTQLRALQQDIGLRGIDLQIKLAQLNALNDPRMGFGIGGSAPGSPSSPGAMPAPGVASPSAAQSTGGSSYSPYVSALPPGTDTRALRDPTSPGGSLDPRLGGLLGGPSNNSADPTAASAAPSGLPASSAATVPALPGIPSSQDIDSTPLAGGADPAYLYRRGVMMGGNPLELGKQIHDQQLALLQQQYASVIGRLDSVTKSADARRALAADPGLAQVWKSSAPAYGFDPVSDLNDANIRTVFAKRANAYRAALSEGQEAIPTPLQNVGFGAGGVAQVDPISGKMSVGHGELETAQFVTPQGIKLLPKATGIARGYQPFDASTYVDPAAAKAMGHLIATYRIPAPTGNALRTQQNVAALTAAQQENPSFDSTKFTAKSKVMNSLAAGPDGQKIESFSTAVQHLAQLRGLAEAFAGGDIQRINQAKAAYQTEMGSAAPTNARLVQNIAAEEVNKIAVGGPGAENDRELMRDGLDVVRASPAQVSGAIDNAIGVMGARLNSMRQRVTTMGGLDNNDFNALLVPEAREALARHSQGKTPSQKLTDAQILGIYGVQGAK